MAKRKQRSDKGKTHAHPEARLQERCKTFVETEFPWAWATATANGARLAGGARAGKQLKDMGVSPGLPDYLFFDSGPDGAAGCALELKVVYENGTKNKLEPAQVAWLHGLRMCGWRCAHACANEQSTRTGVC